MLFQLVKDQHTGADIRMVEKNWGGRNRTERHFQKQQKKEFSGVDSKYRTKESG